MTPAAAAARLTRIADRLGRNAAVALGKTAREGVQMARDLSSGPHSLQELADMGHPYAVRHAVTARRLAMTPQSYLRQMMGSGTFLLPYIINQQTDEFKGAWRAEPPRGAFSGTISASVVNDSSVARYMRGTRYMVARPIWAEVVKHLRPEAFTNVRAAVRRAIRSR